MKKLFGFLLVLSLFLVGCGGKDDESGVTELRISTWAGGTELEEFQEIVDKLNEENKDLYHISIESIPSDYAIKVQTQAGAGQSADLIWISQELIASYAKEGVIISLDDYLETSAMDFTFNKNILAATKYKGEQYGVPWISNPQIIYYNKSIMSDDDIARLEATNDGEYLTFSEFKELAKRYTDIDNKKYGFLMNGWPPAQYFVWANGGLVEDAEGNLTIDTKEAMKGFEVMKDFMIVDPITPDTTTINQIGYTETFQQGNTAMLYGGVADGIELIGGEKPVAFEVGYAVAPGAPGKAATFNYSASFALSADSKNPDIAFQALKDLTGEFFKWKIVPPVDIKELGYSNYEEYIKAVNPSKEGMGKTIEQSMLISHDTVYTPRSGRNYGLLWEELYAPLTNASVTKEDVNIKDLVDKIIERGAHE